MKKIPDRSSIPQKWLLQGTTAWLLSPWTRCGEGGEVFPCPRAPLDACAHHNLPVGTSGRLAWGGGCTPACNPGRSVGSLSFCPRVRAWGVALGPESLVARQRWGLARMPYWGLAQLPSWGLVRPPRCSCPQRWRRPPSAACRAWVGVRRAWGAAEVPPVPALGGRAGLPRDNIPPAPGRQKQGKPQTLCSTYIL